MLKEIYPKLSLKIDDFFEQIIGYLNENAILIISLGMVAFATYGFELFNFNLTIDEEVAATQSSANIAWLSQGRWGMYFLEKNILPYNVIPFVSLFIALIFQVSAILLLLNTLEVKGKLEQIIIGSFGVSFPGMAYVYTFSTLNYGVGIGLFCAALSLFIYAKNAGWKRYWAVIPAAFAISIYQGLFPAIASIYLLYIVSYWAKMDHPRIMTILEIIIINFLGILVYYITQYLIVAIGQVPTSGYVDQFFDIGFLRNYYGAVIKSISSISFRIYSGDESIYGIEVTILSVLMIVLTAGICANILLSKMAFSKKIFILLSSFGLLITPFVSGLLTRGFLAMRFLVGLPIVISGWVLLGLNFNEKIYKTLVFILSSFCIFQFIASTNHLFASSYMALQEDRLLGAQLIARIEEAKFESNSTNVKYMEMIGYLDRPSTRLIPKLETFGTSFFEWDQGNVHRVLLFLQTLGYYGLQALPLDQRGQMVEEADSMPAWPVVGSVKVVGDTVLVKFGPYSYPQNSVICQSAVNREEIKIPNFCSKIEN